MFALPRPIRPDHDYCRAAYVDVEKASCTTGETISIEKEENTTTNYPETVRKRTNKIKPNLK